MRHLSTVQLLRVIEAERGPRRRADRVGFVPLLLLPLLAARRRRAARRRAPPVQVDPRLQAAYLAHQLRDLPPRQAARQAELELEEELDGLGWDPFTWAAEQRDRALEAARSGMRQAGEGLSAAYRGAQQEAAERLVAARDLFLASARSAVEQGSQAAGDAALTLAQRAAAAWASLGEGAGAAWESFWGFKPGEGFAWVGGAAVLVAVLAGGAAVYLLSTAGGQTYLAAVGTGAGSAISSVGAGSGAAVREYGVGIGGALRGLGDAIPSLVKLV